jgi:hypothetical protein
MTQASGFEFFSLIDWLCPSGHLFWLFIEKGSHYIIQADLELEILLPSPLEWWDPMCEPTHSARHIS